MRRLPAFQTSDGALHVEQRDAAKHARRRYDDAMSSIRHAIVASDSYGRITHSEASKMLEWVEQHFDAIAHAAALKADAEIVSDTIDDGENS